jgi:hypothetical protein
MARYTFGPGSLEGVTLAVRQRRAGYTRLQYRIVGWYPLYCGAGNTHYADVTSQWVNGDELSGLLPLTVDGDAHREDIAHALVEWTIEDWEDPCEAGGYAS